MPDPGRGRPRTGPPSPPRSGARGGSPTAASCPTSSSTTSPSTRRPGTGSAGPPCRRRTATGCSWPAPRAPSLGLAAVEPTDTAIAGSRAQGAVHRPAGPAPRAGSGPGRRGDRPRPHHRRRAPLAVGGRAERAGPRLLRGHRVGGRRGTPALRARAGRRDGRGPLPVHRSDWPRRLVAMEDRPYGFDDLYDAVHARRARRLGAAGPAGRAAPVEGLPVEPQHAPSAWC